MTKIPKPEFVFKKNMNIGEPDAEYDKGFLESCFIDTGDVEVLCNTQAPQSIILGRTGAGKSALLDHIEKINERVIRIEPEELALKHISNSTILKFFEDLGVNLDIFYILLWQHMFTVELIKNKYQIDSPTSKNKFMIMIADLLMGNIKKQQALRYIEEWGDKFWIDTEKRIIEFTEKLETDLSASVEGKIPSLNGGIKSGIKLTDEEKYEVIVRGKKVVSSVQIEKLSKVISLLAEDIFTDPQQKTYIIIDKLDENWVEDELRYKLIRALIETVKKLKKIENVKIIFTLRMDLLNRVIEKTRDSGFQREKYDSLFLNIEWNEIQLKELLDKRINLLLKNKYTSSEVSLEDIFTGKINKSSPSEYILARTLLRPRDAIVFVNDCLIQAQGRTQITGDMIKSAERSYSAGRIEALKHEWYIEHPLLELYIEVLHNKEASFKVASIDKEQLVELLGKITGRNVENQDEITIGAINYLNSTYPEDEKILIGIKKHLLFILYKVGVIGIKIDGTSSARWINDRTQDLRPEKIEQTSIVYIHKMLHRALAINTKNG